MASNNQMQSTSAGTEKVAPKVLRLEEILMKQGIDTVLTANVDLMVGGQSTTSTKLSAELAEDIALFQAVDDAAAADKAARQSLTAKLPEMRERHRELRTAMKAQLGSHNPELTKFGIVPPKARRPRTAAENAIKTAKGQLTRKERHTMSKKARAAIKTVGTPTVTIGPEGTQVIPPGNNGNTGSAK